MRSLPTNSVDFILTDPPYLVRYQDREGRSIQNDSNSDWLEPAFAEAYRVLKQDRFIISFYGWTQVDKFFHAWRNAGFRIVGHLVFRKQYASKSRFLKYQHEQAYLLAKGNPTLPESPISDVIDMPYSGNKLHPTQKPVAALKPLIESFTQKHDLVLDPFCGSGSTLLAAKILNRRYLGIELDPQYHAAAARRLHPEGIRAVSESLRAVEQASRPMPPVGVAPNLQQSSSPQCAALTPAPRRSRRYASLECQSLARNIGQLHDATSELTDLCRDS
jgi:site-specific DNA-methyltransferase (adenine-specific)